MLSVSTIILGAIVLTAGSILQGAVGFGYGLFAVPLLMAAGFSTEVAVAAMCTGAMIQSSAATYALRNHVPVRTAVVGTVVRVPFMLFGVFILTRLVLFPITYVRCGVGVLVLVLLFLQVTMVTDGDRDLSPAWAGFAFACSGVLAGMVGMGGVPLVLWAMAKPWTSLQTRAFFFASFATTVPVLLIILGATFGSPVGWGILAGLASAPLVYLGGTLGVSVGNRFSKLLLRRVAFGLLTFVALKSIVPVWIR